MRSKPSKNRNGRSANKAERDFQGWIKYQPCCWCGSESGSIVDHVVGAKTGHDKVHIGHWFVLPNCEVCDKKKTIDGQKLGNYSIKWSLKMSQYQIKTGISVPRDIKWAIARWGLTYKNGK